MRQMQEIEPTFEKKMENGLEGRLRSYTLNPLEKVEVNGITAQSDVGYDNDAVVCVSVFRHPATIRECFVCGVKMKAIDSWKDYQDGKKIALCAECYKQRNGSVSA